MKSSGAVITVPEKERIEEEKVFWDGLSSRYDQFIERKWKIYASSLLDKIDGDVPKGSKIIDVATGTGLVALRIAGRAEQVYAVDISPGMIEEARKKARKMEIENVEFCVEDAYVLPFGNDVFDVAICNNALHNMKYPERALSEMRRVLKPGSRLIATIVGFGESSKYKVAMSLYNVFVKLPVFHKLDSDEMVGMVEGSGFRVAGKEILKYKNHSLPLVYMVAEVVK